jgi:hypothetical protein
MAIYAFDSLGSNLKNSPRPWDRWTDVVAVVVLQTRRPVERQLVKVVQVKEYVVHEGATIVGRWWLCAVFGVGSSRHAPGTTGKLHPSRRSHSDRAQIALSRPIPNGRDADYSCNRAARLFVEQKLGSFRSREPSGGAITKRTHFSPHSRPLKRGSERDESFSPSYRRLMPMSASYTR